MFACALILTLKNGANRKYKYLYIVEEDYPAGCAKFHAFSNTLFHYKSEIARFRVNCADYQNVDPNSDYTDFYGDDYGDPTYFVCK